MVIGRAARFSCALIAGGSVVWSAACKEAPRAKRVLVVTIDTLRADRLGFTGYDVSTPNLDALAASGTIFTDAITVAPLTLPAHASLFTALYPPEHGVRANGIFNLGDDVETMAEVYRSAGYATGAFVGSFVLEHRFGLGQGFDHYDDELPEAHEIHTVYFAERPASEVVERATAWIREQGDAPFFAWVHVFDPHAPYAPEPPFDEIYASRPYDGEIAATDRALGPLLELLGSMDDSLIVVTADHGESLGEHGESTHGLFVYDATTRVPLVMSGRGVPAGKTIDSRVRIVDVAPTVLELSGLAISSEISGESLVRDFDVETSSPDDRDAYSESFLPRYSFNWSELRAYRQGRWKLIEAPTAELYDLEADPAEAENLWDETRPEVSRLAAELADIERSGDGVAAPAALDSETAQRLESLGYVIATHSDVTAERERVDPKERIEVYEHMQDLLSPDLSPDEAVAGYRAILEREPTNTLARNRLANSLSEMGRLDEAVEEYRRLVVDSEIDFRGLENLSAALLLTGRTEEALDVTAMAVAAAPWNPDFQLLRGEALEQAGRLAESEAAYGEAVALDGSAENFWRLGAVHEKSAALGKAEAHYHRALELDDAFVPALAALARLLARTDRTEQAYQLLETVPDGARDSQIVTAEAETHIAAGRRSEAKALLERARVEFPENTRVLALLGPIYADEGNVPVAVEALEAAVALGERSPDVLRNLAILYMRRGEPQRAVVALETAVQSASEEPNLWFSLGNAHMRSGSAGSAADAFERALGLRRPWPEATFNFAVAAQRSGQNAKAKAAYREFLQVGDPSDERRRREAESQLRRLR